MRASLFVAAATSLALISACGPGVQEGEAGSTQADAPPNSPHPATVTPLTAAAVEAATTPRPPVPAQAPPAESQTPVAPISEPPDPALVRVQILLDRSAFSPGAIDGYDGQNTRQAVAAWRAAKGLAGGDTVDAALIQQLASEHPGAVITAYNLTEADVSGPFSPPPGRDMAAQARNGVHYSSARERIAERFHIDEDLLEDLNPGVDFARAGQTIQVPALTPTPLPAVARIDVSKAERSVRVYDAEDRLIAFYPATVGSSVNPSPSGDNLTVTGVAPNPNYTYDPRRLSWGPGGARVVIPPGPNNPVGTRWIDLSRDTYGIHGAPYPPLVGKSASHGCVRLTNWDVEELAEAVKPGVRVRFI